MKAARCTEHGRPEGITVVDLSDPVPGPGEVLVRVRAAAVDFPDVLIVADRYQFRVRCRSYPAASSRESSPRWAPASGVPRSARR
jgi:NADPH:quinone reductase-like Zn-dependent oxidoreductase